MLDVAAHEGWLVTAISICNLVQMIVQGRWLHDSALLTLPHVEQQGLYVFRCSSSSHTVFVVSSSRCLVVVRPGNTTSHLVLLVSKQLLLYHPTYYTYQKQHYLHN